MVQRVKEIQYVMLALGRASQASIQNPAGKLELLVANDTYRLFLTVDETLPFVFWASTVGDDPTSLAGNNQGSPKTFACEGVRETGQSSKMRYRPRRRSTILQANIPKM